MTKQTLWRGVAACLSLWLHSSSAVPLAVLNFVTSSSPNLLGGQAWYKATLLNLCLWEKEPIPWLSKRHLPWVSTYRHKSWGQLSGLLAVQAETHHTDARYTPGAYPEGRMLEGGTVSGCQQPQGGTDRSYRESSLPG